jgi:hypothetical protein
MHGRMTPNAFLIPFICASAAWYHVVRLTPMLTGRGARAEAHVIAGVLTLSAIVAFALIPVIGGGLWQLAGILLWLANNLAPDVLVRATGGPRPPAADKAEVASILDDAQARLEAGDPDGWRAAVDRLQSASDPAAAGVARAMADYARDLGRGLPLSPSIERRFHDEAQRYLFDSRPPSPMVAVLTPLLAAVVGLTPGLGAGIFRPALVGLTDGLGAGIFDPVCDQAHKAAVDGGTRATQSTVSQLPNLLLDSPGPDFTLVWDGPMTLEQSAASRVDTMTLPQLREAGFVSAWRREWIRDDGTGLGNDVFAFAEARGAESYQQAVTAYACRYSSQTFEVPGGGVGLRILYGSGDPVRDQVAWIDGNHRFVVAIGYRDDSLDHSEVLDLVTRARQVSRGP